jgi:hypothetical protein
MAQRLRIQKLVNELGALQGLATTDSPQFTAINLGHASDTTLARSGAGTVTIEGNVIYRAGGTDVPVTDGGTGASTAGGAATNLGLGTGDSPTFTGLAVTGAATVASAVATPAAGSTSARLLFGTTAGFGIYYGSGAPTVSAAQGSVYMRADGSGVSNRMYVNTDGGTTWTAVTTSA